MRWICALVFALFLSSSFAWAEGNQPKTNIVSRKVTAAPEPTPAESVPSIAEPVASEEFTRSAEIAVPTKIVVPAETTPPERLTETPPTSTETVWLDDVLPANAKSEGTWAWDLELFSSGTQSHGHPAENGLRSHGYTLEQAVAIPVNGMITQQVWLDPANPPRGISLQFRLATGDWVGVYWEGEEEVFKPSEAQELWYYGVLPELGKWIKLEILSEDLGLEDQGVTGLRFVTYDGRALWDRTALTEAPSIEQLQGPGETPVEIRPELGLKSER